jgi:hypothetical protein
LNAAVSSLSLMGRNWPEYPREAHRTLRRPFGMLFVAEPAKRWAEGRLEKTVEETGIGVTDSYQRDAFRYVVATKREAAGHGVRR